MLLGVIKFLNILPLSDNEALDEPAEAPRKAFIHYKESLTEEIIESAAATGVKSG